MTPASLEDWFAVNELFVRYATSLDAATSRRWSAASPPTRR